jgi:cell division protein FtsB
VTTQVEQLRAANQRLQEQVKALQSGGGNASVTATSAVVDTKLFSDYIAELQKYSGSSKDKDKAAAVIQKMKAVIAPYVTIH